MAGFSNQWWYARKMELLAVAATECPVIVYNEESLNDTLFDLLALDPIDALFYPMHHNPHPKILRKVFEMGAGFQCGSAEELNRLIALFPEINPETVLFAPEIVVDEDLVLAFDYGVHVLVRNPRMIEDNRRIFQHRKLFLTLTPSNGEQNTAQSIIETLSSCQITLAGFSIQTKEPFAPPHHTDSWILRLVKTFRYSPEKTTLLLGGESAVIMDKKKGCIDISSTEEQLEALTNALPGLTLWLKPGSGVVSGAGVLLAQVLLSTEENGLYTAGTNLPADPPMTNILLRPPHHVVNLSKMQEETSNLTGVSGQEIKASLPMEAGDILLFTNVGACGQEAIFRKEKQAIPEHYLNARKLCPVKI